MKWMQFLTPVRSLDFLETKSIMDRARVEEVTILDVRQPKEYEQSHLPGAVLIPLPQLADRLDEVDREKPVLVY
jgi:rhodanese-related sulfurtransferase